MDDTNLGLSVASLIGVVALYLINKFKPEGVKTLTKAFNEFKNELLQRVTAVETKQDVYGDFMKQQIAEMLHSPHTPEIDRLLEKMVRKEITDQEKCELRDMVRAEMEKMDKSNPLFHYSSQLLVMIESEIPNWNVG